MISGWTLVVWILLAMGSGLGYLASMVVATITGRRIAKSLGTVETEPKEVAVVAAHGLWSAALQLAAAICRHYWPIALTARAAVPSVQARGAGRGDHRRCRGLGDSVTAMPTTTRSRSGLVSYLLLKRLDDIAYGAGLWTGVVRERHVGALKPQIRT